MIALTRDIPASFANALCAVPADPAIDLTLARAQHAAYRAQLPSAQLLPADDTLPDCCFVEDTAVVAEGVALIARPGAPSRRAETGAVEAVLVKHVEIVRMREPATLDGGDCMRVGSTIFVGRSRRTNDAGIARLAEVFTPRGLRVVPIDLPAGVLHLKCVCAPLGEDRITLADATIPRHAFGDLAVISIPSGESYAANVLALPDRVLIADGFPRTHDALVAAGYNVVPLATSEFRKADGALTCLSILLDRTDY